MRPLFVVVSAALLALVASTGCSTLGTPGGTPEGLPHGGTGPFRDLDTPETRLARGGAAIVIGDLAIERGMVAGLHLFYAAAAAPPPPDAGMPDAGMPFDAGDLDGGIADAGEPVDGGPDAGPPPVPTEIDWTVLQPRTIFRSPPSEGAWGYMPGLPVLTSSQAWEGGYVSEPWAIELADGRARLYYTAEGGIGVAEASSIDGTFTSVSTSPIFGPVGGAVPRCPTVVSSAGLSTPGAFFMLYELDGTIRSAHSDDGITFTDDGEIEVLPREAPDGAVLETLPARDERDGTEVRRGCPGMMVAHTPANRSILRVYYESHRDNGATLVGMFGTVDGVSFEPNPVPVVSDRDRRFPAPREVDARISLLFSWSPRTSRGNQRGELVVGVAPGGIELSGATR